MPPTDGSPPDQRDGDHRNQSDEFLRHIESDPAEPPQSGNWLAEFMHREGIAEEPSAASERLPDREPAEKSYKGRMVVAAGALLTVGCIAAVAYQLSGARKDAGRQQAAPTVALSLPQAIHPPDRPHPATQTAAGASSGSRAEALASYPSQPVRMPPTGPSHSAGAEIVSNSEPPAPEPSTRAHLKRAAAPTSLAQEAPAVPASLGATTSAPLPFIEPRQPAAQAATIARQSATETLPRGPASSGTAPIARETVSAPRSAAKTASAAPSPTSLAEAAPTPPASTSFAPIVPPPAPEPPSLAKAGPAAPASTGIAQLSIPLPLPPPPAPEPPSLAKAGPAAPASTGIAQLSTPLPPPPAPEPPSLAKAAPAAPASTSIAQLRIPPPPPPPAPEPPSAAKAAPAAPASSRVAQLAPPPISASPSQNETVPDEPMPAGIEETALPPLSTAHSAAKAVPAAPVSVAIAQTALPPLPSVRKPADTSPQPAPHGASPVLATLPIGTTIHLEIVYAPAGPVEASRIAGLTQRLRSDVSAIATAGATPGPATVADVAYFFPTDRADASRIAANLAHITKRTEPVLLLHAKALPRPGTVEILLPLNDGKDLNDESF